MNSTYKLSIMEPLKTITKIPNKQVTKINELNI